MLDRYGNFGLRQDRADMRSHIVGTFLIMEVCGIAVEHQPGNVVFQIVEHVTVRVFSNNQRSAGVMEKHMAKTLLDIRDPQQLLDLTGDIDGRPALGQYRHRMLLNHATILSPELNSK